jgi:hypothetical protein
VLYRLDGHARYAADMTEPIEDLTQPDQPDRNFDPTQVPAAHEPIGDHQELIGEPVPDPITEGA